MGSASDTVWIFVTGGSWLARKEALYRFGGQQYGGFSVGSRH